jgi:DNA topoisomerase-3
MRIYLCEKPSQARDIAQVLGAHRKSDGYLVADGIAVTWCFGHLFESAPPESYAPELKRWTVETLPIVPATWKLELKREAAKQFRAIKALVKQASEVVIATDADREGETIGREVLDACGWRGTTYRLWLSALDDKSIRKALAQLLPGAKSAPLYTAGQGRARADWLVGMNLTRLYTLLARGSGFDGVLSVGRVQTPTLRLVVDRDREIERFVPKNYWDVVAKVQKISLPQPFAMRWRPPSAVSDTEGRCTNEPAARTVAQSLPRAQGRVDLAETERKREPPPLPYHLSTLQQDCSRRFGLTATQTLEAAQRLYETWKATTYPRTDCQYLPADQFADAAAVLAAMRQSDPSADIQALIRNANPALRSRAWNDAKITAHHAIVPTASKARVSEMTESDRQVYDLIRRRYLAQFYPIHEYDETRIEARFGAERFAATGRRLVVTGWKAVFVESAETGSDAEIEPALPALVLGDALVCLTAEVQAKKTQAPAHYTEGTLIQAMKSVAKLVTDPRLKQILHDTSGIGTEATRASIIETLVQRQYVERQGRKKLLVSTPKGRILIDTLPDAVKDPAMTALWEQALEEIAAGKAPLEPFMERQIAWLRQIVGGALRENGAVSVRTARRPA